MLLRIIYWFWLLPTGILARMFGIDRMGLRPDPKAATYWNERPQTAGVEKHRRQL
jgi:hypothetical protein